MWIQWRTKYFLVFSNIFYENMNFFKENHWSVKIMYFQLISSREICIFKRFTKSFHWKHFSAYYFKNPPLILFISYHMVIWCYQVVGWAYLICIQTRQRPFATNAVIWKIFHCLIGVFTLGPVAFQCKKLIQAKLDIYIHCNKIFNEAIQTFDQTDSILFVKSNQLKTVPNALKT